MSEDRPCKHTSRIPYEPEFSVSDASDYQSRCRDCGMVLRDAPAPVPVGEDRPDVSEVFARCSRGGRYVLVGHELRRLICEDATGLRWERVGDIEELLAQLPASEDRPVPPQHEGHYRYRARIQQLERELAKVRQERDELIECKRSLQRDLQRCEAQSAVERITPLVCRGLMKRMWEEAHDGGDFERTQWAADLDALFKTKGPQP